MGWGDSSCSGLKHLLVAHPGRSGQCRQTIQIKLFVEIEAKEFRCQMELYRFFKQVGETQHSFANDELREPLRLQRGSDQRSDLIPNAATLQVRL